MNSNKWLPIDNELPAQPAATVAERESFTISALSIDTAQYPITGFKIEQKIVDLKSNNNLNIGPFVNGNANIKKFNTRYNVVLFSNRIDTITDSNGNRIYKRHGYGFGFNLDVRDINTKLNLNFSVVAASTSLNLANAGYSLSVNGVVDAQLAQHMPATSGSFSNGTYKSLQQFITAAKEHLAANPINTLYPIEILKQVSIKPESQDNKSIYFGAKKISEGHKLISAIEEARNRFTDGSINENILQFIYTYFGFTNAYAEPTATQKTNAAKWIAGSFNKVEEGLNESWVDIDPTLDDGKYVVLAGLPEADSYQPHPVPANWATAGKSIEDESITVSAESASSFKLASIADVSGKFNTSTITRNISLYMDVSENPVPGSKVIETRYGVGLRLSLRLSQVEFGTRISYATIGAASELGHASVEYEIAGIGFAEAKMLKDFPGPQDINEETMSQIDAAFNALKNKLSEMDVSAFTPQPYKIRVNEPQYVDTTLAAQGYVFSVGQIAEKNELGEALQKAAALKINKEYVLKAYKERCDIIDHGDRPSNAQKRDARDWLNFE